jgi:hypothetical protein
MAVDIFQPPREAQDTRKKNNSSKSNKPSLKSSKLGRLSKVNQPIQNRDDVVYAKNKRIKNASAAKLQASVHIIQLCQSQADHPDQNEPGLPPIKLVDMVDNRPYEKLNR